MSRETQAGPTGAPFFQRSEHFQAGLLFRGRYRIVSELGAGAYGTVCLAEDESTGHRVAIRFLPREVADMPEAAQAVLRAGRSIVAASITHPGLVRVQEFGEVENGRPFAVMEFLEGRRLSEILSEGKPLDIAAAMRLALDLGGAVETLHNMGLVHLALCPRNVMVLGDGRVKLMDVELAGLREGRELRGAISAEPPAEYLSPEQILRAPASEKTDVYAYGAILYELLCGVPPFEAATREAVFTKHLKEAPVPVRRRRHEVPGSVERAVTLALYKQPEPRPLMGDVLNLLWTSSHSPAPRRKRDGVVMIAGGALAALAGVAVAWGVLAPHPSAPPPPVAQPLAPPPPVAQPTAPPPVVQPLAPLPVAQPLGPPPAAQPTAPPLVVQPLAPPPLAEPLAPPPSTERAAMRPPTAPSAPASATRPAPSPRPAALPAAVRATPLPASAPASPEIERREPPRTPEVPVTRAPERPPRSRDADDPSAVIDWLLRAR
jgi:eukaryotic-like serine/threonine-protein kinase